MKNLKDYKSFNESKQSSYIGNIGDEVFYSDDSSKDESEFVSYGGSGELESIEDSEGVYVLEEIILNKIVFYDEKPIPYERITKKGQLDIEDSEDVSQMMLNIDKLPHIIVIENKSGTYEIVDGMHRLSAYNELGRKTIKAWVGKQRL